MKYKLIIIYSVLLGIISCNKYLDKKSNTSLLIPSSLSDAQALLDAYNEMNDGKTPCMGEVAGNDYFLKSDIYNGLILQYQYNYTWRYYPSDASNDWVSGYRPIYMSNLCLDLLKDIKKTSQNATSWDQVRGSALFYRSYYFLELLWDYAKAYDSTTADKDLGIALRLTSDFNVPSTRATNKECYTQVINDTKTSIPLLPDYPVFTSRPSKGAAYGLLARCYLSMRDYDNALLYADSALQLNNNLMDYNGDEDIPSGNSANYPFKIYNKETIFYTTMFASPSFFRSTSKSRIDSVLYDSYDNTDLRKVAFFKNMGDGYFQFKGAYTNSIADFSGIAVDEMYLTRAECYVRTGQVDKGLADLNTLLIKRYETGSFAPYEKLSAEAALDTILLERRKELTMRGFRWIELKRLNKEGRNIILKRVEDDGGYTLEPDANYYALPLPDDLILETGMVQNPL